VSDGPHRSLNMNRSWKHFAKCADNRAYSSAEVASAYLPALDQSCREEVPPGVWQRLTNIFTDQQQALFKEQSIEKIEELRAYVAGQPLGCSLIDAAVQRASQGTLTEDTLVQAAIQALAQRASRGNKQVEEHYYRKTNDHPRTENIRERMEGALKQIALEPLARNYLTNGTAPKPGRGAKQDRLDDGVQL
jgi:hypothetical protein